MKKIFLIIFLATLLLLSFSQVQAAGLVPCGGSPRCCETSEEIADPVTYNCSNDESICEYSCQFCHFFVMFNNIIEFVMFKLVPPIGILMLVIGGFLFFFAGASTQILTRAKAIITSTVIGLVVILSAWMIINTILTQIGIVESEAVLKWWTIECPVP